MTEDASEIDAPRGICGADLELLSTAVYAAGAMRTKARGHLSPWTTSAMWLRGKHPGCLVPSSIVHSLRPYSTGDIGRMHVVFFKWAPCYWQHALNIQYVPLRDGSAWRRR